MNLEAKKKIDLVHVLTLLKKYKSFLFLSNKRVIHIKKRRIIVTFLSLFWFTSNQSEQKNNWKYYLQFKSSDITLQANCTSYIFVNINIRT